MTTTDPITITIDGKTVEAEPGELLISAAERAGIFIPRFCWHKRMDPVGACRMCLVDVEGSPPIPGTQQRRPQTSCTTVVRDGMVAHTQYSSTEINEAQKTILELLLINHPLDCPICDRAGECPLQDQTQDYGPAESRYIEPKRRYEKPIAISPLVNLDRERCILCYRCTRFCEELSGDVLIGVMERGPEAFIFPYYKADESGPAAHDLPSPLGAAAASPVVNASRGPSAGDITQGFDSYFSGNTIQICPVGALTSREYRFQARPWDLQVVETTCNMCASGCAMHSSIRVQDGNLVRFSAAVNEDTNEEWLCDKGRFADAYVSSTDRLSYAYARKGNDLAPVTWNEAFEALAQGLKPVLDGGAAGIIVGESLCDEDAYVAQKFARLVLGTHNIDHRLEGGLEADALIKPSVTYDDVLSSDLVVLVGCDPREELPLLFLRMRIAATKRGLPIAIVHQRDVALSEYAVARVRPLPGDEAAVAGLVSGDADADDDVKALRDALRSASKPVIVLGPRLHDAATVRAWKATAQATGAKLTWAPRRSGTYGALASGAHPELLPGWRTLDTAGRRHIEEQWGATLPDGRGLDVAGMLNAAANGELQALWLVGADVLGDVADNDLGRRALEATPFVIVQDVQSTPLMNYANVVLPAAASVERDGTITDWEGRRLPIRAAVEPPGAARADYAIFAETARHLGRPIGCRSHAEVSAELDALLASSRTPEISMNGDGPAASPASDQLRLLTYRLLYDEGSRISHTKGVGAMTAKVFAELNVADAERLGISDGAQVTVSSQHGTITVDAKVTKGLRPGVVFVPWNQPGATARTLCKLDDKSPTVIVEALS
jgi:NADH-quinone oxidoreductase subunit G